MTVNSEFHQKKVSGKTYISSSQKTKSIELEDGTVLKGERKYRIASKVLEDSGSDCFAKIKNEIVIRRTDAGKQEIKATFYEDARSIVFKILCHSSRFVKNRNDDYDQFTTQAPRSIKLLRFEQSQVFLTLIAAASKAF